MNVHLMDDLHVLRAWQEQAEAIARLSAVATRPGDAAEVFEALEGALGRQGDLLDRIIQAAGRKGEAA